MIVDDLKASILNFAISGNFVKNSNNNASTELQTLYKIKEKQILNKEVLISAKIFPVKEVPFQVPSNWEWVRLGNISKVVSKGTTPQGGKNAYKESGIKFLRAENVKNYKIDETNIQFISEDVHQNFLRRSILEDKDLLICIAGTLGRCGIVSQENLPLNTNQAVSFVRMINTDLINVKYISYAISSPIIQNILIDQKKITAIPNLTLEIIANCLIPLPPLEEQNRIVDKLEKLFFKLDEVKPIEDELLALKIKFPSEMKKSLYLSSFRGELSNQILTDINVEELLNKVIVNRKIDAKEIKKRKISSELNEPYQIPDNWKWIKLGYLCDVIRGLTFSSSYKEQNENTILVLRGGNIDSKTEQLVFDDNIYVDKSIPNTNQYLCSGDTLIVASSGTKTSVGKSAYISEIDDNISFGGFMMVVRPYSEIANPKYISYQIKMYRNKIINDTNGYISNITNEILNNLMIPLPPIEEQQRIVEKLEQLLPLCNDIENLVSGE